MCSFLAFTVLKTALEECDLVQTVTFDGEIVSIVAKCPVHDKTDCLGCGGATCTQIKAFLDKKGVFIISTPLPQDSKAQFYCTYIDAQFLCEIDMPHKGD